MLSPPLPQPVPAPLLAQGCYIMHYQSVNDARKFNGTLRLQFSNNSLIGSGDLYETTNALPANIQQDIPIFPIADYRHYLRITRCNGGFLPGQKFHLEFEKWDLNRNNLFQPWGNMELFHADMIVKQSPSLGSLIAEGNLSDSNNMVLGAFSMMWISDNLRCATIRILHMKDSEVPTESGQGHAWESIFNTVGWKLSVKKADRNIVDNGEGLWSKSELHDSMLELRNSADINKEWSYNILVVKFLQDNDRGIMFDDRSTDANDLPREGIGISSHWRIPTDGSWGSAGGKLFGSVKPLFFRTAVHEIGHAMSLHHNSDDPGLMTTTEDLKELPGQFPNNIPWRFSSEDERKLGHLPDICVRPGGIPFNDSLSNADDEDQHPRECPQGLKFSVIPLLQEFPLGAPVRLDFYLKNTTAYALPVPQSLNMKYGLIKVKVVDPLKKINMVLPAVICFDAVQVTSLNPGEVKKGSMTLLRGKTGPLFPIPGSYVIELELSWTVKHEYKIVTASTNIDIAAAKTVHQEQIAEQVLSNPDTFLSLVISGDHLKKGNGTIRAALKDPVLKNHYSFIEAKRFASKFRKRKPDFEKVAELITPATIMTVSEISRMVNLLKNAKREDEQKHKLVRKILAILSNKMKDFNSIHI